MLKCRSMLREKVLRWTPPWWRVSCAGVGGVRIAPSSPRGSLPDMDYTSEVTVGGKYRDKNTGVEGQAVMIEFHLHSCERVVLEFVKDGELKQYVFDAVRLELVEEPEEAYVKPSSGGVTTSRSVSRPVR